MNYILILMFIVNVIFISNDILFFKSKYLYFGTELMLLIISTLLYRLSFAKTGWSEKPEKIDSKTKNHKNRFFKIFILLFTSLASLWLILWIIENFIIDKRSLLIIQNCYWFSYFLGIFLISIFLLKKYFKFVSVKSMILAVSIEWMLLVSYEIALLSHGQGWLYNSVIIGDFLGVPLGSFFFVYIFAPALSILFYLMITKGLNNKKAFWLFVLIMSISSIIVEFIGINVLKLWIVNNKFSILSIGNSNIEEFLYYIIFNVLGVEIYYILEQEYKVE